MVSKVRNVRLGVFSGGGCHHPNNKQQRFDCNGRKKRHNTYITVNVKLVLVQCTYIPLQIDKVLYGMWDSLYFSLKIFSSPTSYLRV